MYDTMASILLWYAAVEASSFDTSDAMVAMM